MEDNSKRDAGKIRKLMKQVKIFYPNAHMTKVDIFKTFPPTYHVFSGEFYQYKNDKPQPDGFMMSIGDTPLEAWVIALETANAMMMEKLHL